MTHYGLICPLATGHLNTMLPLGKELQQRGHRVTLIGYPDGAAVAEKAGLEFCMIGENIFPVGSAKANLDKLGKLSGQAAIKYTMSLFADKANTNLQYIPPAIKKIGIEALIIDQAIIEGETIAEVCNLPFISICSAVVFNRELTIPPFFLNWSYNPSWWAKIRNKLGYELLDSLVKPINLPINNYRAENNLLSRKLSKPYLPLAQISQEPAELEFPRQQLPAYFHFTGPYHSPVGREVPDFPWDKLTGQPLIYASMGTLQNQLLFVFENIAKACEDLDAQLVISLGGSADPEILKGVPGNPIIVRYAPQLQLLQKANLTITHGGLNTTLECLTNGVPMVAIPVANDQPGVAARIVWSGCGEAIPVKKVNVNNLRVAIKKVLTEDIYKQNALRLQAAIKKAGGTKRAVDIIEQAISTGKPVLNHINS
ncbi:glycosyltransferase [Anabaena sp. FACHB-1237]|uniref:glycosyltransferase n=1 Tax=Anabaena sp. FACHB-1237 TaxID=2692769 RepID=UPI0016816E4A|nr:glycosyltransferase [Anabaena sp. FACHB-1237]MBD2138618.1 glycosyltransferase [Anabaena sp. FACHB-1237]